jgi:hypothetical protein
VFSLFEISIIKAHVYTQDFISDIVHSAFIEVGIMSKAFDAELIAPCGMNCGICVAFFGYTMRGRRRKHPCIGCRSRDKPCAFIKKHCDKLATKQIEYCFECPGFPCENLKTLDNRYIEKYGMSMIENLKYIQTSGIQQFLRNERERWKCPVCGGVVCVHNRICYTCSKNQD